MNSFPRKGARYLPPFAGAFKHIIPTTCVPGSARQESTALNAAYIAAKERWAGRRSGAPRTVAPPDHRIPPGQCQVTHFPEADLEIKPTIPTDQWRLKIGGHVENPITLDWVAFNALAPFADTSDFHCVTTWSQLDMEWSGVSFLTLAGLVRPRPTATHVFFKSYDGYSTNNPLDVCLDEDVLLAHSWNGQPLAAGHGGPVRVIIPKRYAWRGAKWIREITFLDRDILGFWELRGYSNTADPWTDDRFS